MANIGWRCTIDADPIDPRCSPEENCLPKWILPSVEADDFVIIDDFGINL